MSLVFLFKWIISKNKCFFLNLTEDIKVRFFEVNEDNELLWEDFADFSELDVHHQYAIAFK